MENAFLFHVDHLPPFIPAANAAAMRITYNPAFLYKIETKKKN